MKGNKHFNFVIPSICKYEQASCLDDLPALMDLYDFTAEGLLPGLLLKIYTYHVCAHTSYKYIQIDIQMNKNK